MIGIILRAMNGLPLGTYNVSYLGSSEFSTDGTADSKFEVLFLLFRLGPVFGISLGE